MVRCSNQLPHDATPLVNAGYLSKALCALSPAVEPAEATKAAETACTYAGELREKYRIFGPPRCHNLLVHLGLRKRGLCYEWADDIAARLKTLNLTTLIVDRAIARADTWREHNALVLTAPGVSFEQGLVLDAWRHSGRLYWGIVENDSYPWVRVQGTTAPGVVRGSQR
jgi:hypothetical protein